jgi:integrase
MGMGTDEAIAIRAAEEINRRFSNSGVTDLLSKFETKSAFPMATNGQPGLVLFQDAAAAWLKHYIDEKRPAKSTLENARYRVRKVCAKLQDRPIEDITTADCAEILNRESRSEHPKIRGVLKGIFIYAKEQGWFPSSLPNPAAETGTRRVKDKDRQRMTVPQFQAIFAQGCMVVQRAMVLCLQTTLRRSDLVSLRLDDQSTTHFLRDNRLHVIPHKSNTSRRKLGPSRLVWDLGIHEALAGIVRESRVSSMQHGRCPFILHEQPQRITMRARSAKKHHCQVLPARLSRLFAEARQKAMEADPELFKGYEAKELPGLHEVRALASHLYEEQGADRKAVMELMSHTDEAMTESYQAGHKEVWREVTLKLAF